MTSLWGAIGKQLGQAQGRYHHRAIIALLPFCVNKQQPTLAQRLAVDLHAEG